MLHTYYFQIQAKCLGTELFEGGNIFNTIVYKYRKMTKEIWKWVRARNGQNPTHEIDKNVLLKNK
jgi:hypothetical protein